MLLCGGAIAAQPHLQRTGVNLVVNPNFKGPERPDHTLEGWSLSPGVTYDATVSKDNDSTGSLKMTIPYPKPNYSYVTSDKIRVYPGKTYTLAFYMRSDGFPPPLGVLWFCYYDKNDPERFIRNEGKATSVSAINSWQENVYFFRPGDYVLDGVKDNETWVQIKTFIDSPGGATIWIDNTYLGEGIGFEQPPAAKKPFNPVFDPVSHDNRTKVDALGNVEICNKNNNCSSFFPLGIYADGYRKNWSDYSYPDRDNSSKKGFNTIMWTGVREQVQKAKDAGMMAYFELAGYVSPGHSYYNQLELLQTRINDIKQAGLIDSLIGYYWDNEKAAEWAVPLEVTNKIRQLDPNHPIYALQGQDGIARRYNNSIVTITDIVGSYIDGTSKDSMDILLRLDNLEKQQNPLGGAFVISQGIGLKFRPRVFNAIAHGAKSVSFFMDRYDLFPVNDNATSYKDVTAQLWWSDLPNIRREIDQLMPIIRQPHWTSWQLSSNNSLVNFGTRDYNGEGYIIATNEDNSDLPVTFSLKGLPYTPTTVKNFFTRAIEAQVTGSQFTVTIPAYGSKVYVLPNALPRA